MDATAVISSNGIQGFISRQHGFLCSAAAAAARHSSHCDAISPTPLSISGTLDVLNFYNVNVSIQLGVMGFPFFLRPNKHTETYFYSSLPSHLPYSSCSYWKSLCTSYERELTLKFTCGLIWLGGRFCMQYKRCWWWIKMHENAGIKYAILFPQAPGVGASDIFIFCSLSHCFRRN